MKIHRLTPSCFKWNSLFFRYITGLLSLILIAGSLISCAGSEVKKRQSEASRNLGEAYMGQGNYTMALKEFLKAEEMYPDDPILQNDLGLAYMAKEKLDIAITHLKKAIDLNPDYAPARNNLGTAYLAKEEWDAAIATFKEVSKDILYITPHYPLSNLGLAYYQKEEYVTAEKYYQEALKLKPDFLFALKGLGKTYLAMKRYEDAVEMLEKASENAPAQSKVTPEIWLDLAKAYQFSQNYQKALDAYHKVVALAPDTSLSEAAEKEIKRIRAK